jgi:hypothetical protein
VRGSPPAGLAAGQARRRPGSPPAGLAAGSVVLVALDGELEGHAQPLASWRARRLAPIAAYTMSLRVTKGSPSTEPASSTATGTRSPESVSSDAVLRTARERDHASDPVAPHGVASPLRSASRRAATRALPSA